MKIHLHKCAEPVDAEFKAHFERRVNFAMGRFSPRIARLELFLSDENGPRGGLDKSCRLVARLVRHGDLAVHDSDAEWSPLVDRMARLVRRSLERRRARRNVLAGANG